LSPAAVTQLFRSTAASSSLVRERATPRDRSSVVDAPAIAAQERARPTSPRSPLLVPPRTLSCFGPPASAETQSPGIRGGLSATSQLLARQIAVAVCFV